jgi:uridine kinase
MISEEFINSFLTTIKTTLLEKSKAIISIDGVDASGKTTFVKQLKIELEKQKYKCEIIALDDFHNAKKIRYQKARRFCAP